MEKNCVIPALLKNNQGCELHLRTLKSSLLCYFWSLSATPGGSFSKPQVKALWMKRLQSGAVHLWKRSTSLARLFFCFFRIHKLKILDVCYWHLVNICFWDIKYRKYSSLGTGLDWLTDFIKQISTFMLMTTLYPGRYMSDSLPLQQEGFMTINEWNLGDFGCLWVLFSHCVDSVTHTHTLIGWFII